MRTRTATRIAIIGLLGGLGACSDDFEVTPIYNHANARVVIQLNRDLESSESVYVQTRRGKFGELDCSELATKIDPIDGASGTSIDGPLVDSELTKPFYGPEWANPTPEMIASVERGVDSIIDVCIMDGTKVVAAIERDLFQAWDHGRKQGLGGKADDPSGEVRINSAQEYGVRCVSELGEIPFFEKQGDQDYGTYNCLDSTPIPMTVTADNGAIDAPQEGEKSVCDNPQYIYSLCEAGPRVATRTNEQGTRWVLLCRKSKASETAPQGYMSDQFNDIAMIGHNPFTGKTCFFQNALYSKTDGAHVPHPADKVKSTNLWSGVHGGEGSGIQCANCHDADPFIHTPWIDGAVDGAGRPIIPKMGIDPDMALGALDTPYSIVNLKGQGWRMPKQLVSPEANACLKCHRMGDGRWSDEWLTRLEGTDSAWNNITTAKFRESHHKYWMPTDVSFSSEEQWASSEYKTALDFLQTCADNPTNSACVWQDIPDKVGGGTSGGVLYSDVNLSDDELARKATSLIGFNQNDLSNVCSECHTGNKHTLRDWQEKTETALSSCLAPTGSGEATTERANDQALAAGEMKAFGPYEVAPGKTITVKITGSGDADLYVKRGSEATEEIYDCRPYTGDSNETCAPGDFNATGPAKFWVAVKGFAAATVDLTVEYTKPGSGGNARPAKEIVDCMRLEPGRADSPYSPAKAGIFAAAAHLGYFQDVFKQAFPAGEDGNTEDTWAIEYGRFKNRVSMPKGNHPRFSQEQLDIIATWFVRGMPRMDSYIPVDSGPTNCTQNITAAVGQHAAAMATQGWAAENRSNGLAMYGCGGSNNPASCLTNLPKAQDKSYGAGWTKTGTLRVLKELDFNTFFWMRSSPDGRFVANGATGGDGAVIIDLQTNKKINVDAAYDPGFFPDNRGWVFMGTPIGAGFCSMGLLTSNPDKIDFSEAGCGTVGNVGLYQHMAAGLNGGDYFAINSQFTSDNPSGTVNEDPRAAFGESAEIKITPMVYDGTKYTGKPPATAPSPYEGDSVLSPSSKLVINRFGNDNGQLGYVLHRVNATPNGATYDITTTEIARYCVQGAKPAISFDEKFFVTHHYVGANDWADLGYSSANDPEFQEILEKGAANIEVVNMVTGVRTRVTTMKAGQYALFPHFRSDGWIYFQVRDHNTDKEYVLGSDAALTL